MITAVRSTCSCHLTPLSLSFFHPSRPNAPTPLPTTSPQCTSDSTCAPSSTNCTLTFFHELWLVSLLFPRLSHLCSLLTPHTRTHPTCQPNSIPHFFASPLRSFCTHQCASLHQGWLMYPCYTILSFFPPSFFFSSYSTTTYPSRIALHVRTPILPLLPRTYTHMHTTTSLAFHISLPLPHHCCCTFLPSPTRTPHLLLLLQQLTLKTYLYPSLPHLPLNQRQQKHGISSEPHTTSSCTLHSQQTLPILSFFM